MSCFCWRSLRGGLALTALVLVFTASVARAQPVDPAGGGAAPVSSQGIGPAVGGTTDGSAAGATTAGSPAPVAPTRAPSSIIVDGHDVSVDGQLDTVKMYIGDVATYTITARYGKGSEVGTGIAGRILEAAGFEIRDFKSPETSHTDEGDVVETRSFTFSTFTTGTYVIPPIPVTFTYEDGRTFELATMQLSLDVVPVPRHPGEPDDIRDIKPPLTIERPSLLPFVAGAAVVLLVVLGIIVFVRRQSHEETELVITPLDAYEDARRRLDELRRRRESGEIGNKAYHYGFAEILRIYLERRFAFTTLSETTAELLEGLRGNDFPADACDVIARLLEESDMVKFARYRPSAEETAEHDAALDGFLEQTKPTPAEMLGEDEEVVVEDVVDDGVEDALAGVPKDVVQDDAGAKGGTGR